jgi:hypothetical protein
VGRTEAVNSAKVVRINKYEYDLDDGTALIKTNNIPKLKIGDIVEISTDGKDVYWNFIIK